MNFQEEINHLSSLIAEDPDNDAAYFERGELYFRQKAYDKALLDYQVACQINPEYSLALLAQGYLLALKGDAGFSLPCENAKRLYPSNSDAYGWIEQIKQCTQYILDHPPTPSKYNERGIKLSDIGLQWHAIEDYTLGIQADPSQGYIYYNRGLAYNEVEAYPLAIPDFGKAIELDPEDPWGYNDRGNCYNYLGQYDLALVDYQRGLQQAPENSALYNNLADVYFTLESFDQSVHYLKQAIKRDAQNVSYLVTLAELYICMNEYTQVVVLLKRQATVIEESSYALVANILNLLLYTIRQQDTQALEQKLLLAQKQKIDTHWNFDHLVRWWKKDQTLTENIREKIKAYLDIAVALG